MIQQTSGSILITHHDFAEFRERMHALAELAGSVNHLARLAGISQTGLRHYFLSGEPSRPHLIKLAEAAGVNIEWLVTGRGPMRDLPRVVRTAIAQNYEQYLVRHDRDDSEDARGAYAAAYNAAFEIRVPELERISAYELKYWYAEYQAGSAEGEAFIPIPIYELEQLKCWPPERGVRPVMTIGSTRELLEGELRVPVDSCVGFRVQDDALHPTIRPGDYIMCDTTQPEQLRNGIYVITLGGTLMVRRLQQAGPDQVSVLRDRRAYKDVLTVDYPLKPDGSGSDMQIIGRVVGLCGRRIRM